MVKRFINKFPRKNRWENNTLLVAMLLSVLWQSFMVKHTVTIIELIDGDELITFPPHWIQILYATSDFCFVYRVVIDTGWFRIL